MKFFFQPFQRPSREHARSFIEFSDAFLLGHVLLPVSGFVSKCSSSCFHQQRADNCLTIFHSQLSFREAMAFTTPHQHFPNSCPQCVAIHVLHCVCCPSPLSLPPVSWIINPSRRRRVPPPKISALLSPCARSLLSSRVVCRLEARSCFLRVDHEAVSEHIHEDGLRHCAAVFLSNRFHEDSLRRCSVVCHSFFVYFSASPFGALFLPRVLF